jgi:hypothetical protein
VSSAPAAFREICLEGRIIMLSRLRSHVRHNVVGYLALFFALSGTAVAANAALKVGDPAGGDLTGTYPNPSIAANAVNSAKVNDGSLTDADRATDRDRGEFFEGSNNPVPGVRLRVDRALPGQRPARLHRGHAG